MRSNIGVAKDTKAKRNLSIVSKDSQNLSTYECIIFNKERLEKLRDELLFLKKLGINAVGIDRISRFYNTKVSAHLGSIKENVLLVTGELKNMELSEEEIMNLLNRNPILYLHDSAVLKNRIKIFKKCGVLKDVLLHYGSLLSEENRANITSKELLEYAKLNDYKIDLDEIKESFYLGKKLPKKKMNVD